MTSPYMHGSLESIDSLTTMLVISTVKAPEPSVSVSVTSLKAPFCTESAGFGPTLNTSSGNKILETLIFVAIVFFHTSTSNGTSRGMLAGN